LACASAAQVAYYGQACGPYACDGGSALVPAPMLVHVSGTSIGSTVVWHVRDSHDDPCDIGTQGVVTLMLGAVNASIPLPASLTRTVACELLLIPCVGVGAWFDSFAARWQAEYTIPNDPGLVGTNLYQQACWLFFDAFGQPDWRLLFSRGAVLSIQ
jgi:hypothetical protein